eukprot:1196353-Prorocentrum_minimum.AAC.1
MGPKCDKHIANTTEWLPEPSTWTPCSHNEEISSRFNASLYALQFPGRCNPNMLRPVKISGAGFGSIFLAMIKSLSGTILEKRVVEVPSGTHSIR